MDNLRKFNTEADYSAATLNYPAVSWVVSGDIVHFDKEAPTQTFSGLTVHYNITDISQPTKLFKGGGGSGSGSGSGSGGVLPSAMIIDGTAVEVANTYQFSTTGEHIVNYSFADNQIPNTFLSTTLVAKAVIGDAITSIGEFAFSFCTSFTSCTIGSGVTSIGGGAFNLCGSLTSIDIPNSVTSIGNNAFFNCTSLTSITIPNSVTSIGGAAFGGCTSLTSITIPSGVTSIDSQAFSNCTSLTSIVIPDSVTSIGNNAFDSCRGLTSITMPNSVTSIGGNVFYKCSGLTSIVSNATTAPTISSNTFKNVKTGGTLTVPSGSSGYDVWMQNADYYLGLYGWTKVEQ